MIVENQAIPEEIQIHYRIKLLGRPFSEWDQKIGRVKRGYIYRGKKYYDR